MRQQQPTTNRNVPVGTPAQPLVIDFRREGESNRIFNRAPLLTSHRFGWEGVYVEHHDQDEIEADEHVVPVYNISVKLNNTIRAERWIDGKFLKERQHHGVFNLFTPYNRHRFLAKHTGEFINIALDPTFVARVALTTFN